MSSPDPQPAAQAVIDLGAIAHNVRLLRERAGSAAVMAVVKADGLAAFMKDGLKGSRVLSTSQQRQLRKMLDDAISAS